MPITHAHLTTNGSATDATSYTTASISPSANKLILATVYCANAGSPPAPTLSGNSLTWVEHGTIMDAGTDVRVTVFRAMGSPTAGTVLIDFGATTILQCLWTFSEFDGVSTGGTNGSWAVGPAVTNQNTSSTSLTVTLPRIASTLNGVYGGFGVVKSGSFESQSVGSGFTQTGQHNLDDDSLGWSLIAEFRADNDLTVDESSASSHIIRQGVAFQVRAADSAPVWIANGAQAAGALAITPALPSGILTDDILLLLLETANQAISIPTPNGGTWTEVTSSPQGTGTAGGLTATRLTMFWSRYNGTQGAPTTSDSGDHQLGFIAAFRGARTSGDPWSITSGNVDATSDTSLSATGATTTVAECTVVIGAALMDDAQDFGATWTNADLANIDTLANEATAAGNDGRVGMVTGLKSASGAYGATTNTITANSVKGMMTVALWPPAAAAGTWPGWYGSSRGWT